MSGAAHSEPSSSSKPLKSSEVHEHHETIEKHDGSDASLHRERRALDSVHSVAEKKNVDVVVLPVLIRQMPPIIFHSSDSEDDETTSKTSDADASGESTTATTNTKKFDFDIDEFIKPSLKSFFKTKFDKEAEKALRVRRSAFEVSSSSEKDNSGEIGSIHLGTAAASTTAQPGIFDSFIKLFKPNGDNATTTESSVKAASTEKVPVDIDATPRPRVTLGYHNSNNGQTVQEFQVSTGGTGVRVPRPSSETAQVGEGSVEVHASTKAPKKSHLEKRSPQLANGNTVAGKLHKSKKTSNGCGCANSVLQGSSSDTSFLGKRPVAAAAAPPAKGQQGQTLVARPKRTPVDEEFGAVPAAEVEAPVPAELTYQGDFQSQNYEVPQQQQYPVVTEEFQNDGSSEDEAWSCDSARWRCDRRSMIRIWLMRWVELLLAFAIFSPFLKLYHNHIVFKIEFILFVIIK